ncbi:MAG TPA: SDR family NAD(P)-dependent oxidoreductase [Bacteroidales bacterium]
MKGKIIFITGASSGIGEGCARKFASAGSDLILNARNNEKLIALKSELESKYGIEVHLLPFDVRDRDAAHTSIIELQGKWKDIDVLINNAGLVIGVDKEFEGNLEEWDIVLDTNIKGLLNMTRFVTPGMVERGKGHIINIGSIAGDAAYAGGSVYCASKAAVKALSDGLRIDLVDTPLRVTNIKPGMVETNFTVTRFRGDKTAADNFYKGIQPLNGDDVAETVYFAASAPAHIQIAEVLLMPSYQATATVAFRK